MDRTAQPKQLRPILRFCDLKSRGIVSNYAQLKVLIRDHGFPPGHMLSPKGRFWYEDEVAAWLNSRPVYDDTTRQPLRGGAAMRAAGEPVAHGNGNGTRTVDPREIDLEEAIAAKAAPIDDFAKRRA